MSLHYHFCLSETKLCESTVDICTRIVLLKYINEDGFTFFTNYRSRKATHIAANPAVCLLFPWVTLERQVIIQGHAEKISAAESLGYFTSRPRDSQIGAWVSNQSEVISSRIRIGGEGEAGLRGGRSGDLYIFIEVSDHQLFQRDGINLYCRVPVSMTAAAMGGDIEVPTIDGGRSRVKVPAGSQSGRQMRLRGKGMPALRGGAYGDMMIELAVETPVNLTSKQKELLREFEKLSEENNPESSGFFKKVKTFWDGMKP